MGKIDTLNAYIEECDKALETGNIPNRLNARITATYENEIKNIAPRIVTNSTNMPARIEILKGMLINHRDNLELAETKELRELEKLKLQSSISVTNNNNSSSTATSSSNTTVSIANTLERLQALPDTAISQEVKEALEEKLAALQIALDSRDNDKAKLKLTNVLKYIGDKCVDAGIAVLPYLGQVAATF